MLKKAQITSLRPAIWQALANNLFSAPSRNEVSCPSRFIRGINKLVDLVVFRSAPRGSGRNEAFVRTDDATVPVCLLNMACISHDDFLGLAMDGGVNAKEIIDGMLRSSEEA